MTSDQASQAIAIVESTYNRQYNKAQRDSIISAILNYSMKAVGLAADDLMLNFNNLPAPKYVIEKIKEYGAKEFERGVDREKREIATGSEKAFSGDTGGVKCFTAIAAMFSDPERRFSRKEILDAYRKAAQATGNQEWLTAGSKMQQWYEINKMPMGKPPAGNLAI